MTDYALSAPSAGGPGINEAFFDTSKRPDSARIQFRAAHQAHATWPQDDGDTSEQSDWPTRDGEDVQQDLLFWDDVVESNLELEDSGDIEDDSFSTARRFRNLRIGMWISSGNESASSMTEPLQADDEGQFPVLPPPKQYFRKRSKPNGCARSHPRERYQ